jgi:hypothetical protein
VRFFFTMPAVWWTLECDKTKQSGNDGKPRNEIMAPTFGLRTHAREITFSSISCIASRPGTIQIIRGVPLNLLCS